MLDHETAARQLIPLLDAKLQLPECRTGVVDRPETIRRLCTTSARIVSIVAPAGYGSTTLLAQWSAEDPRPFAHVSLELEDNDPGVLLTCLAEAVDRILPIDPSVFGALLSPHASALATGLPRLGAAIASLPTPFVLAIDNVHVLDDEDALSTLSIIASDIPDGSTMALSGRRQGPVPVARLRSRDRILELGVRDLRLDESQIREVLRNEGVELPDRDVATILERTEGWPVAVYLAAVGLRTGALAAAGDFAGDVRPMAQYIEFELLSSLPRRKVTFMTRTSVLERMCGPLCDAVLESTGSQKTLRKLEDSTLMLVPLDQTGEWFRYHRLMQQLLRSQLERNRPLEVVGLLARAADWCEASEPEESARYAMEIGDADHVARLFSRHARALCGAGRAAVVLEWLDWLERKGSVEGWPEVLAVGAWLNAFEGRPAEAERLADVLDRIALDANGAGGAALRSAAAAVRAALCRDGVDRMRRDAEAALTDLDGPWRPAALLLLGEANELEGQMDLADDALSDAEEQAAMRGQTDVALAAVSARALLAAERNDWSAAESLLDRASATRADHAMERYGVSALGLALSARAALRRGDVPRASRDLARATRLRPMLTHAVPWYSVQSLIELVRAHVSLADPVGARTILREIDAVLRRRPGLGNLPAKVEELRSRVDAIRVQRLRGTAITAAELRLLPHLTTHLTFGEIGERLHVSPHTVKTQAVSIYRKLGVTSRAAAIERAKGIGILDP